MIHNSTLASRASKRHKSSLFKLLLVGLALELSGLGCVSVNLAGDKVERASDVRFSPPASPFEELKSNADRAWKSAATGSTIAYLSTCGEASDLPLENLSQDLLSGFEDSQEIKRSKINFDSREALDVDIKGKLDGVLTRTRAIVYKKNRCSYSLTFVSLPKNTETDSATFENFLTSFKAP